MACRTETGTPLILSFALVASLGGSALLAEGSGSIPQSGMNLQQQQLTPQQEAERLYNDAVGYKEKADKLSVEAEATTDPKKKAKLEAKSRDKREDAIAKYKKATEKYPQLYQAWGGLGHAYRMIGNYDASLAAYDKALEIQPGFTPAIEYRGEAYLGLNRLDDVRAAYMQLFTMDRPRADTLGAAIEKWIAKTREVQASPAGFDEFVQWAEDRKKLASQTSALSESDSRPSADGW
jgi:tetratricopeptide (TPR) repeat protein